MKVRYIALSIILTLVSFLVVRAGGISVDSGLTPAQNRWILRTQYRRMEMYNSMMTTKNQMMPFVIAYGLTSNFTLMARGMYVYKSISTEDTNIKGFNDFYFLSKFKLYRKNTANYVFGIAPFIASNIPVGSKKISDRVWSPEVGINVSYRPRFWAFDFTLSYVFSDGIGKEGNDIFEMNTALSSVIPFKNKANIAISPVLEFNFKNEFNFKDITAAKAEILFLSPGISYIYSSLVIEALVQFPVYQKIESSKFMKQNTRLIIGIKYMF